MATWAGAKVAEGLNESDVEIGNDCCRLLGLDIPQVPYGGVQPISDHHKVYPRGLRRRLFPPSLTSLGPKIWSLCSC